MLVHHCLVTGANGFLGMNLIEQLTKDNWRVIALCQPGTEFSIFAPLSSRPG
jgi:nucleoside-diphosphate-sugar epimerase